MGFKPARVAFGSRLTLRVPPYAQGELKLTFQLAGRSSGRCSQGTMFKQIRAGTTSLHLSSRSRVNGHRRRLPRGRYRVGVRLTSGARSSKTHHLVLVIR
ncbi:MAG: hypothetical protein ACJ764_07910 [Solirubrobacteraceae bacterium]